VALDFNQHEPIYLQIIQDFKMKFLNGFFKPGQEIPSRRETASMMQVNPNTVQRAYMELENEGLIRTLRGQGSFVTDDEHTLRMLRESMLQKIISDFIRNMEAIGLSKEEIDQHFSHYIREERT
jgi:GntR family transcriptional regulator